MSKDEVGIGPTKLQEGPFKKRKEIKKFQYKTKNNHIQGILK